MQKFSDDSALVGYIINNDFRAYEEEVSRFVEWCDEAQLILNVEKTKELTIDFRRKKTEVSPILIRDQPVEIVSCYKYLGVHVDNKLDWKMHSSATLKKSQSRMFFLRKLRSFNVSRPILNTFYNGILASVLFYAVVCWGSCLAVEDRNRLNKLIRKAGSVIGLSQSALEDVIEQRTMRKIKRIVSQDDHPLHSFFIKSGRSQRLLFPSCSTERFRRSFVPSAVRLFNKHL